jgi:hypothetical protein
VEERKEKEKLKKENAVEKIKVENLAEKDAEKDDARKEEKEQELIVNWLQMCCHVVVKERKKSYPATTKDVVLLLPVRGLLEQVREHLNINHRAH